MLTGKYQFEFIEDEEQRENAKVIGYMAYFELLNGFRKVIYWSKAKMEKHALEYSQGYKADKAKGTAYTFWSKDFNGMAFKTMLRQLISKWGIMSTTLEKAYINDMSVVKEDGSNEYVDSDADNFEYNTTPVVEEEPVKEEPKVASKRVVREETEEQDIASLFAQAGIDTK